MYRRRRSAREKISFNFDSFLDLVANIIGIVMRLILVAWVGARAYQAGMERSEEEPPPDAATLPIVERKKLEAKPNPLEDEISRTQSDLEQARRKLLAYLDQYDRTRVKTETVRAKVEDLKKEQLSVVTLVKNEDQRLKNGAEKIQLASLSLDKLQARSQDLLAQIKALEKDPPARKVLHYRTPVSKVVDGEELMFECRGGRVSYIDLPAFLHEIKNSINDDKLREIAAAGRWDSATSTVGAFRLRFSFEAVKSLYSAPGSARINLASWTVEAVSPLRGETLEESLKEGSDFRRLVDRLDPTHTTVTFWVYPDSFALFRGLRDVLYDNGVEVAGRPLPSDHPIGASAHGTRSRGQ